jgi:hypothetical protein
MKVKSENWLQFKRKFTYMLDILGDESDKFSFGDSPDDFSLFVNECEVIPIFARKDSVMRVEYDFTMCNTRIRTLALSIYMDAARIEMTLKDDKKIDDEIKWQENHC